MPDLNLDLNFRDHPKTRRFIAMLGKDAEFAPVKLWLYVARIHPEGKLKGYSAQEIESIAEWAGTPGAFIEAMEKVEWLERVEKNGKNLENDSKISFQLIGWKEHQGHLIAFKKRGKIAAKARWAKGKQLHALSMPQAMHKTQTSNAPTDGANGANGRSSISDELWRKTLQSSDAYKHVAIESEFQKAIFWCEQRRRRPTRKFFLNWINKVEKPMDAPEPRAQKELPEYQSRRAI